MDRYGTEAMVLPGVPWDKWHSFRFERFSLSLSKLLGRSKLPASVWTDPKKSLAAPPLPFSNVSGARTVTARTVRASYRTSSYRIALAHHMQSAEEITAEKMLFLFYSKIRTKITEVYGFYAVSQQL